VIETKISFLGSAQAAKLAVEVFDDVMASWLPAQRGSRFMSCQKLVTGKTGKTCQYCHKHIGGFIDPDLLITVNI